MKIFAFVVGVILLSGCATLSPLASQDLTTQASVEISRYMGDWFIIANIPTSIEKESVNAKETYRWDEEQKRIFIDYSHHHSSPQGPVTSYLQEAWIADQASNAQWKVRPVWPLQFDYMILDVAPDYSYSLVGLPDRSYVWIMSRHPSLPEVTYHRLVAHAEALGFDTSKLRKIPQVW